MKQNSVNGEKKQNKNKAIMICHSIFIFLLAIASTIARGLIFHVDTITIARNTISVGLFALVTVFAFAFSYVKDLLLFDNEKMILRFYVPMEIGILVAVAFSLLPETTWMFLPIFVLLFLFSNALTGLSGGTMLLMITLFCSGITSVSVFSMYFIPGVLGIMLFSSLDEECKYRVPLFISVMMQFLMLFSNDLLLQTQNLSVSTFILPGVNVLLGTIVLFLLLQVFCNRVILPQKNLVQTINDPEYPLMAAMREKSRNDYYHGIHTAYLAVRICSDLGMDVDSAKMAAYYQKADLILGESDIETIMEEHRFPDSARKIIRQLRELDHSNLTKETTVVIFCDSLITTLEYFADKKTDPTAQYAQIVNRLVDKKIETGVLNHSMISVMEMNTLRKELLEEGLYYDFIRLNRNGR